MLQQGDSSSLLATSSGDVNAVPTVAAAAAIGGAHDDAGGGGAEVGSNNSAGEEDNKARGDEGDRSFGGNRWPRQETLALLKIRSDMDQVFRDSSLKGPLWEEVSRKLAERGYNRSAKKCKEKFENVYKYHKRTKEGRTGKPEGKHYKFFDQLEALDHHHHHQSHSVPQTKPQAPLMKATAAIPWSINPPSSVSHVTVSISAASPINIVPQNTVTPPRANPTISATPLTQAMNTYQSSLPPSYQNVAANLFSSSTSSSTASDEESEERGTRKRKWKVFFKRLTKEVIKKQEELQNKFLEEIERRERDRIVREEAWRIQEMTRINREHEILIQERTTAAAKDAAVIAFLQKISGQQQNPVQTTRENLNPQPPVQVQVIAVPPPLPQLPPPAPPVVVTKYLDTTPNKPANGETAVMSSSSRWPKAEVEALIRFRTDLANKYQENGPKGPLWEEISAAMKSVGYNRSAKRCKEKWENINKYFKKVKESNKKRPEDSKTCPYFNQLEALYKEKSKTETSAGYGSIVKAVNHNMAPLMVQPEQQWPLHQQENHLQHSAMSDIERDNVDQIQEDDEDTEEEYEEEEEEGNGDAYEIVANKPAASMGNTE